MNNCFTQSILVYSIKEASEYICTFNKKAHCDVRAYYVLRYPKKGGGKGAGETEIVRNRCKVTPSHSQNLVSIWSAVDKRSRKSSVNTLPID